MKKTFLLLITIFFINIIYSQNIECSKCLGRGKTNERDWITCSNCKDWSESYREKVPCNVCKDNRGHWTAYHEIVCTMCNGTGRDYDAEKKAEYNKFEYENPNMPGYFVDINKPLPTEEDLKRILIRNRKISGIDIWNFDFMNEFKSVDVYSKKIGYDGKLNIKAKIDLEDNTTKDQYHTDISFIFSYNDAVERWTISDINGKIEKK